MIQCKVVYEYMESEKTRVKKKHSLAHGSPQKAGFRVTFIKQKVQLIILKVESRQAACLLHLAQKTNCCSEKKPVPRNQEIH